MHALMQRVRDRVPNGECRENSGYRQVVLSQAGVVRDVVTAKYSGKISDRHTVQAVSNGDYIVKFVYPGDVMIVCRWMDGQNKAIGNNSIPTAVLEKLQQLKGWLTCKGQSETYLPAGFGWDGFLTSSDKRKMALMQRTFKGIDDAAFSELFAMAKITPKVHLPMDWNMANSFVGFVLPYRKSMDHAGILLYVEDHKGESTLYDSVDICDFGVVIPSRSRNDVLRAAVIYKTPFKYVDTLYGVAWELFARD